MRGVASEFSRLVAAAKTAVIDSGMYGAVDAAAAALDACADFDDATGVVDRVRRGLRDQAVAEAETKGLAIARQLISGPAPTPTRTEGRPLA